MRRRATALAGSAISVKLMRMAAPREAACGCPAARRYAMPSAVSASAVSIASRSFDGATHSSSPRPSALRTYRPARARSASNSRTGSEFMGVCSLHCLYRSAGNSVIAQASTGHPLDAADVVAGDKFAAGHFADKIHQHVVILGAPLGIAHDALEDIEAIHDFHAQAGLFESLAAHCILEFFTGFEKAPGDGPPAFQRLARPLHQQHSGSIENDGADAEQRVLRILAANKVTLLSRPTAHDTPKSAP